MIREISAKDFKQFAQAGVDFSSSYPNGIKKFLEAEIATFHPDDNFFFKQGGHMQCFIFEDNKIIIGRIAAMINPELQENGETVGLIGLFDCVEEYSVAQQLLDVAIKYLKQKKCSLIWGPMDFSIWHHYRFMTQGFERYPFYGEPRNPEYYPKFFEQYGFKTKTGWESQVLNMKSMELFYDHNKEQLELFYRLNYSFEKLTAKNKNQMMDLSYALISSTYHQFPAFSAISLEVFKTHFKRLPDLLDKDCTLFVKNPEGKYVGFLLVFKDITMAVKAMNGKSGYLSKLKFLAHRNNSCMANIAQGAALPHYIREAAVVGRRQLNKPLTLAGATMCQAIKNIMDSGRYEYAVISLMRDGAHIKNHANDESSETRTYQLYQLEVHD